MSGDATEPAPSGGGNDLDPGGSGVQAAAGLSAARSQRPELADLISGYFAHVLPEDQPRRSEDVLAVIEQHRRVARQRAAGEAVVRLFNQAPGQSEWAATSTVIDIVNDDMPYLVDSVIGALTAAGLTVHRVVHPILTVRRSAAGELEAVLASSDTSAGDDSLVRESWMHVLVDRITDAERAETIESALQDTLAVVRAVVTDSAAIAAAAIAAAAALRSQPSPRPDSEVTEAADLLGWLTDGNLSFLGYRREDATDIADARAGVHDGTDRDGADLDPEQHGLGVWRHLDPAGAAALDRGPARGEADRSRAGRDGPGHLSITQDAGGAVISPETMPLVVSVSVFDPDGSIRRRHVFTGVLALHAVSADLRSVPVIRRTVDWVLDALGATVDSYTGTQALATLDTYPRAELFWADPDQVHRVVVGVLQLASRRRLRAFLQPDPAGTFVSVLVFLPRDRWTTDFRLAMQRVLLDTLDGNHIRYAARIGDSPLAVVHFTVLTEGRSPAAVDLERESRINAALRSTIETWEDRVVAAVVGTRPTGDAGDLDTAAALTKYGEAFDLSYKQLFSAGDAVADLARLDALEGPDDLALAMSDRRGPGTRGGEVDPGERRLKLFVTGGSITLSRALPILTSLGAEVLDEQPFRVRRSDRSPSHIYDFGLRFPALAGRPESADGPEALRQRIADTFVAAWQGTSEVDGFNALVVSAGLDVTQVGILRAYSRYQQQLGTTYTQGYVEQVLLTHCAITRDLVALFGVRFEPGTDIRVRDDRTRQLVERITAALDAVASLDADRILRSYLNLIGATVRTNAYRQDTAGAARPVLALKLLPHRIPGLVKPVPVFEIWVYSPRLEGVHLRFGPVARGGLRWSDRPEDFRTEVLGLVKAQEVKNAVIVPVGAKGGFVVRQPPAPTGNAATDREAVLTEGTACYRLFVSGLLDLTDNRGDDGIVPPPGVVRHDTDDPYLVVAADKGTASFSDIANGVASDYGFWLGDAFASGGSAGYDHKAMGITARGAWESVRHHFRELGIDVGHEPVRCVGVGDMSGDVFGNAMLLSKELRLIAAFDHRHIFIDPDPDPRRSLAERRRLFELPRSSWADYAPELLSAGGGVWPRTAKSVPIGAEVSIALGLPDGVTALTPVELIRAILLAPVDLLFNGGIGTYVKSALETDAQAGDKANDAVRVNGRELRVRVVGEGGNLGLTQLGRIEFARAGGLVNTDAIDNSAGVDTSDHEVNIKIALTPAVASGDLSRPDRDDLLERMTEDVAALVLADNVAQNRVLGVGRQHAAAMVSVHARLIDDLVARGRLDRALEFLPSRTQLTARMTSGESLLVPELAVLMAYVKSDLSQAMLADDLPDETTFASRLTSYFPPAMRDRVAAAATGEPAGRHPLTREIVTTMTVNQVVNEAGLTYAFRLGEEYAATPTDAIRAHAVVTGVFDLRTLWVEIAALDLRVPAVTQNSLYLSVRRLLDRAARWVLHHRPAPLAVTAEIDRYAPTAARLITALPELLTGADAAAVATEIAEMIGAGVPTQLAGRIAHILHAFGVFDVVEVVEHTGRPIETAAAVYYALSAHLDFDRVLSSVSALPRGDRWHALARQALRDDLYQSVRLITIRVLTDTPTELPVAERIDAWERSNSGRFARAHSILREIADGADGDLAAMSVAASEFRTLIG